MGVKAKLVRAFRFYRFFGANWGDFFTDKQVLAFAHQLIQLSPASS